MGWDNELAIEYLKAHAGALERATVNIAGRVIKVSLRSGVEDPSAPGGGMLYNLNHSRGGHAE